MLKKLFPFTTGNAECSTVAAAEHSAAASPEQRPQTDLDVASFEEIYRRLPTCSSKTGYGILKVAEMADSPHLAGMSAEAKRASVMMALEAAGVDLDDLLQDAIIRQRALNDHEEAHSARLKAFEAAKLEENRKIQAELERITAQHMHRVQANLDQVARQQDLFREWRKKKDQEAHRIADAAAICVPKDAQNATEDLSLLLAGARR
jgi:hypothetical protein